MILPKNIMLSIQHNPQKMYHDDIKKYVDRAVERELISSEDAQEVLKNNSLWVMTWYPQSCAECLVVMGSTIERCLELAQQKDIIAIMDETIGTEVDD